MTSHTAGDQYIVSAEVIATDNDRLHVGTAAKSPTLTVVPGAAETIVLSVADSEIPADTLSETRVTAYVKDGYTTTEIGIIDIVASESGDRRIDRLGGDDKRRAHWPKLAGWRSA